MDTSTIAMLAAALVLWLVIRATAPASAGDGLRAAVALFIEVTPRMIAAFVLAGLLQAIVPQEMIAHWMGKESGSRGIVIGTVLGTFTPGGPMIHFPIIASLYNLGIGIGPLVAYLTAWSLLGFQRIIMWELPFLGAKVVFVRVIASVAFPVLAGWLSELVWGKMQL